MPQITDGPTRQKPRVKGTQSKRDPIKVGIQVIKMPEKRSNKKYSFVEGDPLQTWDTYTYAEKQMQYAGWSQTHNKDARFQGSMMGNLR